MKRYIKIFNLYTLFLLILISGCGKSVSYQDACEKNDYITARKVLSELKDDLKDYGKKPWNYDSSKHKGMLIEYADAVNYVYLSEMRYFTAMNTEEANTKVLVLYTEAEAEWNSILKMDVEAGLWVYYSSFGVGAGRGPEYDSYPIDDIISNIISLAISLGNKDLVIKLADKLHKIESSPEVITYLATNSDNNDYIIKLVCAISLKGKKPRPGMMDKYDDERPYYHDYQESIIRFNGVCDMVFNVAINNKNKDLALSILNLYKEDVGMFDGGSSIKIKNRWYDKAPDGTLVDGAHRYIWFDYKSKNDAQKKYTEAVKAGAFK